MENNPWYKNVIFNQLNPYDLDTSFRPSLSGLTRLMDMASYLHIKKLGISMQVMQDRQLAWVLYQKHVNIIKPLVFGTEYNIETIITGKDRVFTYRDFHVSLNEEKYIECSTSWLLFDLNERQFLRTYPDDLLKMVDGLDVHGHLARPEKLKKNIFQNLNDRFSHTVRYSDLDSNQHISNATLVSYMADAIDLEQLKAKRLRTYDIQYVQEAQLGDKIIFKSKYENNLWYVSAEVEGKTIALSTFELI